MTELQWRRQWKPDLSACPWRHLPATEIDPNGADRYLVKTKFHEDACDFFLTDLVDFWYERLAGTELKQRVKDLNPNVEAPLSNILDQIRKGLESPGKETRLSVNLGGEAIHVEIESHLASVPFLFSFKAMPASQTMAKDHLTVPLMAMVGELYRQQAELFKLLAAKDKQIDDYKGQGAKVTRKNLETKPFDEVAFKNSMVTSQGFEEEVKVYGDRAFTTCGQDLYREITTKRAWILSSPIKDEPTDGATNNSAPSKSIESWGNRLPPSIINNKNGSPSKGGSPVKSLQKSPGGSGASSADSTPVKDSEMLRRQALERKLEQEEAKAQEKNRKKKKLKF